MAKSPARRIAPHIAVINGHPTTTSRDIAETFGKRHADVLARIRSLDCSKEFNERNFSSIEYLDGKGVHNTEYRITRDGFSFLCMGFTGARAAQWKEKYIDTFNRMADKLAHRAAKPGKPTALPPQPVRIEQALKGIDVRALMLTGLTEPVPLTRSQQALVNRRAWTLAHDAYELVREHIERRIAFKTIPRDREDPSDAFITDVVKEVTLGNALAHEYHTSLRSQLRTAQCMDRIMHSTTLALQDLVDAADTADRNAA